MRMPRVRFTVRGMMIAVAVAGMAMGAMALKWRRDRFLRGAGGYSAVEQSLVEMAFAYDAMAISQRGLAKSYREVQDAHLRRTREHPEISRLPPNWADPEREEKEAARYEREALKVRKRAEWCRQLKRKYDRLARYPWLPVAPDPPELQ